LEYRQPYLRLYRHFRRPHSISKKNFIFTRNGTFILPHHFTKKISSPLLKAATQGRIGGLHRLRHFFASMLIAQGESPKYVQDQLGHKSITTTFDIYGHVMGKAKKEATAKLEASLLGSQGDVRTLLESASSDDNEQTIN
jgi:integrase